MTTHELSRSSFLKTTGVLIVSFGVPKPAVAAVGDLYPYVDPARLDSWIAVGNDGRVTAFTGRTDYGQHKSTAYAQIVADELDVPFSAVTMVMGDTARTVNQGASTSSDGMLNGAKPIRHAAAEARYALVSLAARRFNVPAEQLTVADGVVSVVGSPSQRVSYAQLIGNQHFDITLQVTHPDTVLVDVTGNAKLKESIDIQDRRQKRAVDRYPAEGTQHLAARPQSPHRGNAARTLGTAAWPERARCERWNAAAGLRQRAHHQ